VATQGRVQPLEVRFRGLRRQAIGEHDLNRHVCGAVPAHDLDLLRRNLPSERRLPDVSEAVGRGGADDDEAQHTQPIQERGAPFAPHRRARRRVVALEGEPGVRPRPVAGTADIEARGRQAAGAIEVEFHSKALASPARAVKRPFSIKPRPSNHASNSGAGRRASSSRSAPAS